MRWPEPLPAQRCQILEDLFVSLSRTRQLAHLQTHIPLPRVGLVKNDGERQQATASARLTQDDVETSGVRCARICAQPRFIYPGLGQELAPWRLPPGCCGVTGPDPSTTRDKGLQHVQAEGEYNHYPWMSIYRLALGAECSVLSAGGWGWRSARVAIHHVSDNHGGREEAQVRVSSKRRSALGRAQEREA